MLLYGTALKQQVYKYENRGHKERCIFTNSAPLGRVGHRVAMSVCVSVCLFAPSGAVFFEASHWPSGHMTRSWPLIGQPPPAPP